MKTAFCPCPKDTLELGVFGDAPVLDTAAAEAERLLGRLDIGCRTIQGHSRRGFALTVTVAGARSVTPRTGFGAIRHDGFHLAVTAAGVAISAPTAKGVLNGLYDLAERLGYLFLMPGDEGEWAPDPIRPVPAGNATVNPRFPHRGVFGGLSVPPFTADQWLAFFAKLRFNAHSGGEVAACARLGIRPERGGHGMAELLPRKLFETRPELFRMFQPEDFAGRRMADANFCPTHPETARMVRGNFRRQLAGLAGVYAVHAWADDLPAGGWCMCPRCRAFTPSDQSQLAMNLQAEAIRLASAPMRVPTIAYHDTLFPGRQIRPAPECFLLYAPRERCYAHALDDPRCARNRIFLNALRAWTARFAGHDDAHTFEYYCDQILYRGHYPFLPEVILGDMRVYEQAGIESHMTLQVGGALAAPDFNQLLFARAHWDAALTPSGFITSLAGRLDPAHSAPWRHYLSARAAAYTAAFAVCEITEDIYFDYRFMPELADARGAKLVHRQGQGTDKLEQAAGKLAASAKTLSPRAAGLAAREAARARFEAADLRAMQLHQAGLNGVAAYLNTRDRRTLKAALTELGRARKQLARAAAQQRRGAPHGRADKWGYYPGFVKAWSDKEIAAKIAVYRAEASAAPR